MAFEIGSLVIAQLGLSPDTLRGEVVVVTGLVVGPGTFEAFPGRQRVPSRTGQGSLEASTANDIQEK